MAIKNTYSKRHLYVDVFFFKKELNIIDFFPHSPKCTPITYVYPDYAKLLPDYDYDD